MGLGGFLKSLGKGALKVGKYAAPIALGMTGVGLPAAMALSGGLNALDTKVSGGSWKDALISGGIGAGAAAIPVKGIGPSSGVAKAGVGSAVKRGVGGTIGAIAKETGKSLLKNPMAAIDLGGGIASAVKRNPSSQGQGMRAPSYDGGGANYARPNDYMMRGLGPTLGRMDQSNPNLAEFIGAGRLNAIQNQPFRKGYDVTTYGPEPADDAQGNEPTVIKTPMPPIYPTGGGGQRRRYGART